MPPPTSRRSTFGSSDSMTASLSDTLEPPTLLAAVQRVWPASAGTFATTAEPVSERDGVVTVRVRDSGPGVESGIGDRVFARGFSTKATGRGHGRGIGLALVRVVCRKRGGDVTVRNDGGAVFVATLPVRASVGAP